MDSASRYLGRVGADPLSLARFAKNETGAEEKSGEGAHSQDFLIEILMFVAFFVGGVLLKVVSPTASRLCPKRTRGEPELSMDDVTERELQTNTSYTNYMCFLRTCICMFGILWACSLLLTLPQIHKWGLEPLCAGLLGPNISLVRKAGDDSFDLCKVQMVLMAMMTLIYGTVVLVFAWILRISCVDAPILKSETAELLDRTVWLKWLPVEDRRQKKPFMLEDDEFQQVENDLVEALDWQLIEHGCNSGSGSACMDTSLSMSRRRKSRAVLPPSDEVRTGSRHEESNYIQTIHVVPVIDTWNSVSIRLRDTRERAECYDNKARAPMGTIFPWMRVWYRSQARRCRNQAFKLRGELLTILVGKKRLSGCAFVTFHSCDCRNAIMSRDPPKLFKKRFSCVDFRRVLRGYTVFSFGRIPFSSVTLKCEPAPHPDDVQWQNLHTHQAQRYLRFWACTILLFFVCVSMVTPSLISQVLAEMGKHIEVMQRFGKWLEEYIGMLGLEGGQKMLTTISQDSR